MALRADDGLLEHRVRLHLGTIAHGRAHQHRALADGDVRADLAVAVNGDVRADDGLRADLHARVDEGRGRVHQRHARAQVPQVDALADDLRALGELGAIVDAGRLFGGRLDDGDGLPFASCHVYPPPL